MQIQLVKFHTFSQPPVQDPELPSFDDAFDKDSLRKFYKDQDSLLGTPFTTYTEAPMYEDLQSTFSDKNIFGSPFTNYMSLNLGSEIEDAPNNKVFQMFENRPYGLEEPIEEKNVKNPFKLHRLPVQQRLFDETLEEKSRINISFDGSLEKDNSKEMLIESSSLLDQFAEMTKKPKKPVFTIQRNVIPKVIAKIEKETKKTPILEKAKKALKEKKEEKKKEETKKESQKEEKKKESKDQEKKTKKKNANASDKN
jgi:hypothetical protein